ncbi:hypothetical protein FB451DRAFT_1518007 [Mycena latifolia]|nr:hypothetical protein FB451DRAFT_1518007 [Mycena latifolia]
MDGQGSRSPGASAPRSHTRGEAHGASDVRDRPCPRQARRPPAWHATPRSATTSGCHPPVTRSVGAREAALDQLPPRDTDEAKRDVQKGTLPHVLRQAPATSSSTGASTARAAPRIGFSAAPPSPASFRAPHLCTHVRTPALEPKARGATSARLGTGRFASCRPHSRHPARPCTLTRARRAVLSRPRASQAHLRALAYIRGPPCLHRAPHLLHARTLPATARRSPPHMRPAPLRAGSSHTPLLARLPRP